MVSLTLAEFSDLYRQRLGAAADDAELFRLYLRIGGLPGLRHTDLSDLVVDQMLADIVSTIAIRDVIRRHRIRDVALFEAVTRFAVDSVGGLVSAKRIADFLKNQRRTTAVDTVLNYLAHLSDAFLLTPIPRFDLQGRRLLQVNRKHYLGELRLGWRPCRPSPCRRTAAAATTAWTGAHSACRRATSGTACPLPTRT